MVDIFALNWPHKSRAADLAAWRLCRMGKGEAVDDREPPLDDLLEDPIARALMASDGVERRDIERLMAKKRRSWFTDRDD